jgi:hypothetical protein
VQAAGNVGGGRLLQVVLSEPAKRIHALVQYTALVDIRARGFSRTFCIAYVSHDLQKIMDYYSEMLEELNM